MKKSFKRVGYIRKRFSTRPYPLHQCMEIPFGAHGVPSPMRGGSVVDRFIFRSFKDVGPYDMTCDCGGNSDRAGIVVYPCVKCWITRRNKESESRLFWGKVPSLMFCLPFKE